MSFIRRLMEIKEAQLQLERARNKEIWQIKEMEDDGTN
jgi:hypothetical protein